MSDFKENTKYVHFFAQQPTIYRFYRFATTKNRFWGYFNDLTNIWHILTSYDVINDVILCQILRKIQNLEIFSPKTRQYIDFVGLQPQIFFGGYFNDLIFCLHILTSYGVINDVILCRILRKLQKLDIFRPQTVNISILQVCNHKESFFGVILTI